MTLPKHQARPTPKPEYEGIHVDVWYDELEHLAGQHVWKDNVVYKILEDQNKNTEFNLANCQLILEDVLLYSDQNDTLPTVKEVLIGDIILDNNKIYSLTKDETEDFPDNGFLIVASVHKRFYQAAMELADSIKLFWPDAHITIFTSNKEWIEPGDLSIADWIVDWGVPNHIRAKLWALGNTPYKDLTCYLDADMVCQDEDIALLFDEMPEDLDLLFTKIRPYNAKVTKLTNTEEMTAHCGMFIYRNNPITISLMESWYGEYLEQTKRDEHGWVNEIGNYPDEVRKWDTFTMWKLLTYNNPGVKWADDLHVKWNFINGHNPEELDGDEIVLYHYTIPEHEVHRK